jgi:hypothetical protein
LPDYGPSYELPAYEWLWLCQCAATGDYADAAVTAGLIRKFVHNAEEGPLRLRQNLPLVVATEAALGAQPPVLLWRSLQWGREEMIRSIAVGVFLRLEQADLATLEGLQALEQGSPAAAAQLFQEALRLGGKEAFAGRPLATAYLARLAAAGTIPRP